MPDIAGRRQRALAGSNLLAGSQRGIEKESLRVTPDGYISTAPHPEALGSALTNRYITTDFSEALIEFITSPVAEVWEAIQFLCDLHQFAHQHLGEEVLWAMSMPCMIRSESLRIPDRRSYAKYSAGNFHGDRYSGTASFAASLSPTIFSAFGSKWIVRPSFIERFARAMATSILLW